MGWNGGNGILPPNFLKVAGEPLIRAVLDHRKVKYDPLSNFLSWCIIKFLCILWKNKKFFKVLYMTLNLSYNIWLRWDGRCDDDVDMGWDGRCDDDADMRWDVMMMLIWDEMRCDDDADAGADGRCDDDADMGWDEMWWDRISSIITHSLPWWDKMWVLSQIS